MGGKSTIYDWRKLHYLSPHLLHGETVQKYGFSRLAGATLDAWLCKKFICAGRAFDDKQVELDADDLKNIDYHEAMQSLNSIKFEVCAISGGVVQIHPDEDKHWQAQDTQFRDAYTKIKKNHDEDFKDMLKAFKPLGEIENDKPEESVTVLSIESTEHDKLKPLQYESEGELHKADEVEETLASEEADVSLLVGKSGHVYALSKKGRTVCKGSSCSGAGTGKYVPEDNSDLGYSFCITSDKQSIQVHGHSDESLGIPG